MGNPTMQKDGKPDMAKILFGKKIDTNFLREVRLAGISLLVNFHWQTMSWVRRNRVRMAILK